MKFFKVKIGYGADEVIQIDETELQKALKAQVKGGIVIFEGGSVSGNSIISILPDYNRALGVNPEYKLTGEDFKRLGGLVVDSYRKALLGASMAVLREVKGLPKEVEKLQIQDETKP